LHSRVLENFALVQTSLFKALQPSFHFSSVNYGYYCLFSLIFFLFSKTRRAANGEVHDSSSRPGTGTFFNRRRELSGCFENGFEQFIGGFWG